MKFIVDAHLPPGLCALLEAAGHDAIHTSRLAAENRTSDEILNQLSIKEQRIVVTKDSDFYHSHLLHGKPWKLLASEDRRFHGKETREGQVSSVPFACLQTAKRKIQLDCICPTRLCMLFNVRISIVVHKRHLRITGYHELHRI